jgi:hypothetical protein
MVLVCSMGINFVEAYNSKTIRTPIILVKINKYMKTNIISPVKQRACPH